MDKIEEYDAEIERLLGLLMVVYTDKINYRASLYNKNLRPRPLNTVQVQDDCF